MAEREVGGQANEIGADEERREARYNGGNMDNNNGRRMAETIRQPPGVQGKRPSSKEVLYGR